MVKISKPKLFFVDVDVDFIISFSSSLIIEENEDDEEGGKVFVSFSAQSEEGYLICGRLNQRRIREIENERDILEQLFLLSYT